METIIVRDLMRADRAPRGCRLFTGEEEHITSLAEASRLTHNYRVAEGVGSVKGGYMGRAAVENILSQDRAVGIRLYFARHLDGRPTLVLSGVEPNGNDLFEGILNEDLWLCPPWCSPPNLLNSETDFVTRVRSRSRMFNGLENHYVTLAEASRLTRGYQDTLREGAPKGGYFSRRIFSAILAQSDCVGVRIYLGRQDDGTPTLVLVGAEESGADIVPGVIGEDIWLCPPWCSARNPLNS